MKTIRKHPRAIGELSEMKIITRLMELGYTVSRPVGDNQRYDLIIEENDGLLKCQCKTGRIRDGIIIFNTVSVRINAGGYFTNGYKDTCDLFLVYCPENQKFYKINVGLTNMGTCSLRINNSKINNKKTRWAKDFEL